MFDRDAEYSEFVKSLGAARKSLGRLSTSETNRLIQRLRREHNALLAIDFFPNDASRHAEIDWLDFVSIVDTVLALDEPRAADGVIPRQSLDDYQGKSWATRQHLWVDRVCSAWLIRRFIDPKARFVWLKKPADCPKKAIGFDFDGATFTHVGNRVTFEILLASFGFARDTALTHLGEMVRALDVGGGVVPEAPGFEAVLTGARQRHPNDDALLDETGLVLDSLYIHFSGLTRGRKKK